MERKYQVINRKSDINHLINGLHKEELLSIGIMDTGTADDLLQCLSWYCRYFNHSLHVITSSERMAKDISQTDFPDVSFIVFDKSPTLAERANAMANNCMTTFFFLTRSDIDLVDFNWKAISELLNSDKHPAVLAPIIFNKCKELIPTVRAPHQKGNEIDPLSFMPSRETDDSLYPFLGIGLYDRAVFQRLRGYDEQISGAYWQTLDFGTRCWLYGYSVLSVNHIAVIFISKQFLIEDRSDTDGTDRFYTKALGIRESRGRILVHKGYRTNKTVLNDEVKPRAGLYKTDFENLIEKWEIKTEN